MTAIPPEEGRDQYVGTIVGESTSTEFRLAVAHEAIREQDIVAVDAQLQRADDSGPSENIRVWAKVQRIERLNPLFPSEAGHELAATRTDPFDTVLSLSHEMVTAVCQVLGSEPRAGNKEGKLNHLRYPPKPASTAYRPDGGDISRIVLGQLAKNDDRALDIAALSNRDAVTVKVDGHVVVTRHLAILAMTGAGKTWAARRTIEELSNKKYPIVIFDPRGDYTGLSDIPDLKGRVKRYYAQFPVFDEEEDTVAKVIGALGYPLSDTMRQLFPDVFDAARLFGSCDEQDWAPRAKWLAQYVGADSRYPIRADDMWLISHLAWAGMKAVQRALQEEDETDRQRLQEWGWKQIGGYTGVHARSLEAITKRTRMSAAVLTRMQEISRRIAGEAEPLPQDRTNLVADGRVSIVSLAGYTSDFQATIYSLVADSLFNARVSGELQWPVLLVLEEAHNFAPAKANTPAEERAVAVTKQIAQEGRKFNIGLVLISQRPSRLDETTLSQCNSYVIMRLVNPADQNFVRRVVETLGEDDARILPDLDRGEAILSGQMVNFPVLVKMKVPQSRGEHEEEDAFQVLAKAREEAARHMRVPR
jgi:DNA helicase HerA-like ATPase